MRSLPAFSDTRFSLSFFLTTPAKKPRTECCCQPVAFIMAARVVPLGSQSIFSTVDCLEDEAAGAPDDGAVGGAPAATFDTTGTLLLVGGFTARRGLSAGFAAFDFDFRVAIWISLGPTTASRAATDAAPL